MGHGYKTCTITADDREMSVPALRTSTSDFPNRRVRLLHLHGSLTYWSNMERTVFAKIDTANLAYFDQWGAVREGRTDVRPVVVLANQRDKSAHVTQFPFNVAYEAFEQGLQASSHWLVVGYSFRDICVNDMLRKEFSNRTDKPTVLVVTYGDQPSDHEVERAFGWGAEDGDSSPWLTINRGGANDMKDSLDWQNFIPASVPAAP
ncbi:SIR2 family protein [Arthrobacter sp. SD76]|uniref:SIR2 family protein n=1 Tax=Arthrobacter sp. SD76 TaxID=3415007 RepID=UPI003C7963F6